MFLVLAKTKLPRDKFRLDGCSYRPQFGKESQIERLDEIADSRRAACTAFKANDALHGGHVTKTPLLEVVFNINQLSARAYRSQY